MNNIHKYHVRNNGTCVHEDFLEDFIKESDDSTWINTTYEVNMDLVPSHYNEVNEDTEDAILAYHYGNIEKPEWIIK